MENFIFVQCKLQILLKKSKSLGGSKILICPGFPTTTNVRKCCCCYIQVHLNKDHARFLGTIIFQTLKRCRVSY